MENFISLFMIYNVLVLLKSHDTEIQILHRRVNLVRCRK